MPNGSEQPSRRETRLLVLVVVVSLAVLLALARFRFPSADLATVTSGSGALGGLVARATLDDAAGILSALLARVSPAIVVVQLDAVPESASAAPPPRGSARAPERAAAPAEVAAPARTPIFAAALRVRSGLAVVHVPPGWQPTLVPATGELVSVAAFDPTREIALIHIAGDAPSEDVIAGANDGFGGSSYTGLVDAAPAGATIQPLYVGRTDRTPTPAWPRPIVGIGRDQTAPVGAFVFSLDGRLVGYVAAAFGGVAIVPAESIGIVTSELLGRTSPQ